MLGNGPVRFGGRPHEKDPPSGPLAVRPTQLKHGPHRVKRNDVEIVLGML